MCLRFNHTGDPDRLLGRCRAAAVQLDLETLLGGVCSMTSSTAIAPSCGRYSPSSLSSLTNAAMSVWASEWHHIANEKHAYQLRCWASIIGEGGMRCFDGLLTPEQSILVYCYRSAAIQITTIRLDQI
jgi:hypothetical protein